MKFIKETLSKLSDSYAVGNISDASDLAYNILSEFCECKKHEKNLGFYGVLNGENDYTLMLDAHIDEVAFTVTDIDSNGFLTVAACGGIDLRTLPAKNVIIHGKEKINGIFISTPPHLSKDEVLYDDISQIKIDTCLGEKAKELISLGDFVTYCTPFKELIGTRVTGKSLDNRAGVTVLLELARRLYTKKLPINVVFSVVDQEELGMRGAKPASYVISPDEAIAVDVTFAVQCDVSENEGGYLSKGGMIGVSPTLDRSISDKLNTLADENNIEFQNEIMGKTTGTDADVISVSGKGVKTGLVSIPLKYMHTDCEVIDLCDIKSICDLLEKYILSGGIYNV